MEFCSKLEWHAIRSKTEKYFSTSWKMTLLSSMTFSCSFHLSGLHCPQLVICLFQMLHYRKIKKKKTQHFEMDFAIWWGKSPFIVLLFQNFLGCLYIFKSNWTLELVRQILLKLLWNFYWNLIYKLIWRKLATLQYTSRNIVSVSIYSGLLCSLQYSSGCSFKFVLLVPKMYLLKFLIL